MGWLLTEVPSGTFPVVLVGVESAEGGRDPDPTETDGTDPTPDETPETREETPGGARGTKSLAARIFRILGLGMLASGC